MTLFAFASLLFLLVLAAFFAAAEVALVSLSRVKVRSLRKQKLPGSEALHRLKARPRRMIITILIGNNVVNVAASALVTVLVVNAFGSTAVGIAAGILTIILLIFGEVLPKTYAQARAEQYALLAAYPIEILTKIMLPLVLALEFIARLVHQRESKKAGLSEKDISAFVELAVENEVLEPEEEIIINKAMRFSDTVAAQVMTPLQDVFALPEKTPVHEVAQELVSKGFSRAPIFQDNIQHVIGIAILPYLVSAAYEGRADTPVKEVVHDSLFVKSDTGIDDVFKALTEKHTHMAIVRDKKKRVVGIVTLEDLLEELVGEIGDETDKTKPQRRARGA